MKISSLEVFHSCGGLTHEDQLKSIIWISLASVYRNIEREIITKELDDYVDLITRLDAWDVEEHCLRPSMVMDVEKLGRSKMDITRSLEKEEPWLLQGLSTP